MLLILAVAALARRLFCQLIVGAVDRFGPEFQILWPETTEDAGVILATFYIDQPFSTSNVCSFLAIFGLALRLASVKRGVSRQVTSISQNVRV